MKRGDIFFADLDPTVGAETQKKRPVLVVSNNANNNVANTITVVPLTSNVSRVYPFEVLLKTEQSGLSKPSKAQCHQVRTISKIRISGKRVGSANRDIMQQLNSALKVHLDLR